MTASRQAFVDMANEAAKGFLQHGATRVVECWGDDVPDGKVTDFRRSVQATADETVVFAWIEWPDRAARDAGMAAVMADPAMEPGPDGMPFDTGRMIFGGFVPVVEAG